MDFFEMDIRASAFNREGFCQFDPVGEEELDDAPKCPRCGNEIAPSNWLPPYHLKLTGKQFGDLCSSGYGRHFLLSERFIDAYSAAGLVGLEVLGHPAKLRVPKKLQESPSPYKMVRPRDVFTHLDEEASGLEIFKLVGCDHCRVAQRTKVQRLRIDEETWDDEDIFYPTGLYGVLVVTRRWVELVDQHHFTNFYFTHQDDYRDEKAYE